MRETMQRRVITLLSPRASLAEALQALARTGDLALPVIGDNGFIGVVLREDLMRYAPSPATSLSKWELDYLLDEISIADEGLIKSVPTIDADSTSDAMLAAFRQGPAPVVALTAHGRFLHLFDWRDLLEELAAERQTRARELVAV